MSRINPFDGDSHYAQFAQATYKRLMQRDWVKYEDIMADYLCLSSSSDLPFKVSKCDNYGELKKAFGDIRDKINKIVGINCFEVKGNNRNKSFRYIGENDDPLEELLNAKAIKNLSFYWKFCQDSSGFLPLPWLDYYLKDSRDLYIIKERLKKGEQIIRFGNDSMPTNIELLPFLYDSILNERVLTINYRPYKKEKCNLVFHPHCLKEFKGLWYLLGFVAGETPVFGYILALDRIIGKPEEASNINYVRAPLGFYREYFRDIIGVRHLIDSEVKEIHLRTHSLFHYEILLANKLHNSQSIYLPFARYDDGEYGELTVRIAVNDEFIESILQMGASVEVVCPNDVRMMIKERAEALAKLYM